MINILHIKSRNLHFLHSSYPVRTPKADSVGFIMTGKNNGGYKYGGITEKPPNLIRHN